MYSVIQCHSSERRRWMPACAGMTCLMRLHLSCQRYMHSTMKIQVCLILKPQNNMLFTGPISRIDHARDSNASVTFIYYLIRSLPSVISRVHSAWLDASLVTHDVVPGQPRVSHPCLSSPDALPGRQLDRRAGGKLFDIDIETCRVCGGAMKVIACIEDPLVIKKILTQLRGQTLVVDDVCLPQSRAPPQGDLFS
jgi:hypothetical protein